MEGTWMGAVHLPWGPCGVQKAGTGSCWQCPVLEECGVKTTHLAPCMGFSPCAALPEPGDTLSRSAARLGLQTAVMVSLLSFTGTRGLSPQRGISTPLAATASRPRSPAPAQAAREQLGAGAVSWLVRMAEAPDA